MKRANESKMPLSAENGKEHSFTANEVYELAMGGANKSAICAKLGVSAAAFNKHCLKHPEIIDAMNQGQKEYLDGIKMDVAPAVVEALKKKLAKGDMRAIELGVKDILGFSAPSHQMLPQIGILPAVNFDFSRLAPEEQTRKLSEIKRARELLLEADVDVVRE